MHCGHDYSVTCDIAGDGWNCIDYECGSEAPSQSPTESTPNPSAAPTSSPTALPTVLPTSSPTVLPSGAPTPLSVNSESLIAGKGASGTTETTKDAHVNEDSDAAGSSNSASNVATSNDKKDES